MDRHGLEKIMTKRRMQFSLAGMLVIALTTYSPLLRAEEKKDDKVNDGDLSPELLRRPNHRRFNVRILAGGDLALGSKLEDHDLGKAGAVGALGIDWVLKEPIAFSMLAGYAAFVEGDAGALQDLFVTVGFRLRLFIDKSGAATEDGGNLAGHLFLDGHFGYHSYEKQEHAGYNVGLGYELSISKDFNIGPFVRFAHTPIGDGFSYMSISFGIQASVGGKFEPDDVDNDGIEDKDDKCPLQSEDKDGFEYEDGCEEPDNDGDGVLDVDDKCPETPGVATNAGCEENDNDHDGILNKKDECPDDAEDPDDFKDDDGCPDPDNDGDGLLDDADECPQQAEDRDNFEDEDGCPDLDNDKDGVPDTKDQCPFIPETRNEIDDDDGCPDFIALSGNRILLKTAISFDAEANVAQESMPILDELARLLKLKSNLKIRVESYTDIRGGRRRNQKISTARAVSIRDLLIERGVAETCIEAVGMGRSEPIVDNNDKAERKQKNRIEIHVIAANDNTEPEQTTPSAQKPKQENSETAEAAKVPSINKETTLTDKNGKATKAPNNTQEPSSQTKVEESAKAATPQKLSNHPETKAPAEKSHSGGNKEKTNEK